MSVAYYIVLDIENPQFDTFVNGKAVAHAAEELTALCEREGLICLEDYMGQSLSDLSDLIGEDLEPSEGEEDEAQWCDPKEGIATIDALIGAVQENTDGIESADAVIEDLRDYQRVLQQAEAAGAQWHLALDI